MPLILGANSLTGGYEVDNSLRFNSGSSDYLSQTHLELLEIDKYLQLVFGLRKVTTGNILMEY
jgi:hypothetical protein